MKIARMHFLSITTVATLLLSVAIIGSVKMSQAQAAGSTTAVSAQIKGQAFTYQGYLSEFGNPANGSYDFYFSLYNALNGGSQVGSTVYKDDQEVTNGLFSVQLDFGAVFDGTGLWLEAAVRPGTSTGSYTVLTPRNEITPAPYSLYAEKIPLAGDGIAETAARSDHEHFGENWIGSDSTAGLTIDNNSTATSSHGIEGYSNGYAAGYFLNRAQGNGVYGYSVEGAGVLGVTANSSGYAGRFINSGGVAIIAEGTGKIKSTADTKIVVSPLDMVVDDDYNSPLLIPTNGGYMIVRERFLQFHQAYLPVDLPSVIFGVPQKLKSIEVCYYTVNEAHVIDYTSVDYINSSGQKVNLIFDEANHHSTSWDCITTTATTPVTIEGPVFIDFGFYLYVWGDGYDIVIGSITLTLTEN